MNWARVAACFEELEGTARRNLMVEILASLFTEARPDEVAQIIYLSQGRVVPRFEPVEFGVGEALMATALATASGQPRDDVLRRYRQRGDYGLVAVEVLAADGAATDERPLEVADAYAGLRTVAEAAGEGAQAQKTQAVAGLFRRATPQEAKYLARITMGQLRLGVGDPTIMDGLSFARTGSKAARKLLERAYNICADLGLVGRTYWERGDEGLEQLHVAVGIPVRPALCERADSPEVILKRLGRCAIEPKIDGFRIQLHKQDSVINAYSRNLENFSEMFPELVEAMRSQANGHQVILEGEAVGYDPSTLEFLPFQQTMQRRRKYDIEQMAASLPLKLLAFDLLYLDGEDLTGRPWTERREKLVDLLGQPVDYAAGEGASGATMRPNEAQILDTAEQIESYFALTVERGQEGIVAKRLDSAYQAGKRDFNWIKLKRSYRGELHDTVDCVVLGYWYGRGNRARLGIGTLLTAAYDPERDLFTTVTRLGTGFSEEEWVKLRELLDAIRVGDKPARVESLLVPDVWVEPRYVIEIQADEITKSPMHTTGRAPSNGELSLMGYALRFPRVLGFIREDRRPEDATTVAEIISLYQKQGQKQVEA